MLTFILERMLGFEKNLFKKKTYVIFKKTYINVSFGKKPKNNIYKKTYISTTYMPCQRHIGFKCHINTT
jgi:hypothetical protein